MTSCCVISFLINYSKQSPRLDYLLVLVMELLKETEYFSPLQSTVDISKSKFISVNLYLKVSFLVPDNLL